MTAGDFSGMTLSDWLKGREILRESQMSSRLLLVRLCTCCRWRPWGKSMCTERTSPELAGLVDTVVTLVVGLRLFFPACWRSPVLQDAIETSCVTLFLFR